MSTGVKWDKFNKLKFLIKKKLNCIMCIKTLQPNTK